ncbi:hypothetical protein EYC80_000611 [Monilinia laxa]|nr:hypothetical protein EYC80_000611 [Monilinia laxa]
MTRVSRVQPTTLQGDCEGQRSYSFDGGRKKLKTLWNKLITFYKSILKSIPLSSVQTTQSHICLVDVVLIPIDTQDLK